jgi:hypothetical protein
LTNLNQDPQQPLHRYSSVSALAKDRVADEWAKGQDVSLPIDQIRYWRRGTKPTSLMENPQDDLQTEPTLCLTKDSFGLQAIEGIETQPPTPVKPSSVQAFIVEGVKDFRGVLAQFQVCNYLSIIQLSTDNTRMGYVALVCHPTHGTVGLTLPLESGYAKSSTKYSFIAA